MSGLPEVGARYGRYLINRLAAPNSAVGVAYDATDTMLRRSVVLTVVPYGTGGALERQERFRRESELLARVRSRNVVTILDHGTIDNTAYRATDHFPDGDLAARLHGDGPMTRAEALRTISQVSGALADAHAAGVVHPSTSPDTIVLRNDPDGVVPLLSDFSSAREGQDTDRSDQHAVGVLLWTCLTGAAPSTGAIPQLSGRSADDKAINILLQRLLSPDLEDRYVSMGELRAAIDRIAQRGTSTAPIVPAPIVPAPIVTVPVAPLVAGETVRTEPTLFRSQPSAEDEDRGEVGDRVVPEPSDAVPDEPDEPADVGPAVAVAVPTSPMPPTVAPPLPPAPPAPAPASAPAPEQAEASVPVAPAKPASKPVSTAPRTARRSVPPSDPEQGAGRRRPWWLVAAAAAVLVIGGGVVALTRGGDDTDPPRAASASPTSVGSASPSASPTPEITPSPISTPAAVVTTPPPAPAKPKPAIGALTRSNAACEGTAGDYQKWAYPLTGFKPGRTLTPHLAIRSDRGNGETNGKPVTISAKGRARGDFCVPTGTRGTVTITVADTTAKRAIG